MRKFAQLSSLPPAFLPLAHTVFRASREHVRRAQGDKRLAVLLLVIGELTQKRHRRDSAFASVVIESCAITVAANMKAKASEAGEKVVAIDA